VKEEITVMGFEHSRLRAHLPPIADVLNRWADKKATSSLWNALGFAKSTGLPANVRLLCKFLGLYIASRIQRDNEKAGTIISEKMDALLADTEFKAWSTVLDTTFRSYFDDKSMGLENLYQIIVELQNVLQLQ
jgi:cytochrome P450